MGIFLRDFEKPDLAMLEMWASRIGSDNYMSRHLPTGSTSEQPRSENVLLWSVVVVDDTEVGTVWLERGALPQEVTLGILLGDVDFLGKGIGEKAINLAIERAQRSFPLEKISLNVRENNPRAIACYKKCGFEIVSAGYKIDKSGNQIRHLTMERKIE